jgi:hypothetical protein
MAEADLKAVERLASFGRALEGTINITQEDIDEVPSDDYSPSASISALPPTKASLLALLKKKRTNMYKFVQNFARKPMWRSTLLLGETN